MGGHIALMSMAWVEGTGAGGAGAAGGDCVAEVVGVTTAGTEGENVNFTWAIDASLY